MESTEEVSAWVSQNMDPAWSGRFLERQSPGLLDMAVPRGYASEPPARVGILRWPAWGACRWAEGNFLCDTEALAAIRALAYAQNTLNALNLVIDDGSKSITTSMYMLPPRPLAYAGDPANALWLLTLVDERFFWWFKSASVEVDQGTDSWSDLFGYLATGLGITLSTTAADAAYLDPPGGIHWSGRPLPVLLDAAASSVGMRVVRSLAGDVTLMGADASLELHQLNLLLADRLAGGHLFLAAPPGGADHPANIPESVTVVFDRDDASDPYQIEVALGDLGLASLFGNAVGFSGTKRFRSTAVAGTASTPDNSAELTTLAEAIATDFYKHLLGRSEARYEGAVEWQMEGLTGIVEYEHCRDRISTRVSRPPELEHADTLLHLSTDYPDRLFTFGPGSRIHAGALTISERLDLGYVDGGVLSTNQTALASPNAPVLYVNATSAFELRGIAAPDPLRDQFFVLVNVDTETITVKHQYATGTTAANRIITPQAADYLIHQNCSAAFLYDTDVSRWRVVNANRQGISVIDYDGVTTTTQANVLALRFLTGADDGFDLSLGATVTVSLRDHDQFNSGIVTTAQQSIYGRKIFQTDSTQFDGTNLWFTESGLTCGHLTFSTTAGAGVVALVSYGTSGLDSIETSLEISGVYATLQRNRNGSLDTVARPSYRVVDGTTSTTHEGAYATTGGLTFAGGLYVSGSMSAGLTVGTTAITGGSSGDFLYNNAGSLGSTSTIDGGTWP